jgi:hypothetical protein
MGIDHTPDLTIDTWQRCLRAAPEYVRMKRKALGVYFTGGEPTMLGMDRIQDFIAATLEIAPRPALGIFSNAATPQSREMLATLAAQGLRNHGAPKVKGQPDYTFSTNMFMSPVDTGITRAEPCDWGFTCGHSVDEYGMTPCPMGGTIDGILKLGVRTWDWNELTTERLMRLCAHCGRNVAEPGPSIEMFDVRGFRMTREWKDAVDGWSP